MTEEKTTTENEEKKSISFVEQIVENDLAEGKMANAYRHDSHRNLTDTYTSDTPRPSAWTSE